MINMINMMVMIIVLISDRIDKSGIEFPLGFFFEFKGESMGFFVNFILSNRRLNKILKSQEGWCWRFGGDCMIFR